MWHVRAGRRVGPCIVQPHPGDLARGRGALLLLRMTGGLADRPAYVPVCAGPIGTRACGAASPCPCSAVRALPLLPAHRLGVGPPRTLSCPVPAGWSESRRMGGWTAPMGPGVQLYTMSVAIRQPVCATAGGRKIMVVGDVLFSRFSEN